jgi:hypothetical protein
MVQVTPSFACRERVERSAVTSKAIRQTPQQATEQLVRNGAIMKFAGAVPSRVLVGHWEWLDEQRAFCFAAFGDAPADAHVIKFDCTQVVDAGIFFLRANHVVGHLSTIPAAGVDDVEDYQVAWQIWQQVKPLQTRFINACLTSVEGSAR